MAQAVMAAAWFPQVFHSLFRASRATSDIRPKNRMQGALDSGQNPFPYSS